jgi:hypothetical protein
MDKVQKREDCVKKGSVHDVGGTVLALVGGE